MQAVADESLRRQVDDLKKTNERIATTNAQLKAEVNRVLNELEQKCNSVAGLVSRDEVMRELREKFKAEYRGETIDEIPSSFKDTTFGPKVIPYIRFVSDTILKPSLPK